MSCAGTSNVHPKVYEGGACVAKGLSPELCAVVHELFKNQAAPCRIYSDNIAWGRKTVKYNGTVGNDDDRRRRRSYKWSWKHKDLENTDNQHRSCYC